MSKINFLKIIFPQAFVHSILKLFLANENIFFKFAQFLLQIYSRFTRLKYAENRNFNYPQFV